MFDENFHNNKIQNEFKNIDYNNYNNNVNVNSYQNAFMQQQSNNFNAQSEDDAHKVFQEIMAENKQN